MQSISRDKDCDYESGAFGIRGRAVTDCGLGESGNVSWDLLSFFSFLLFFFEIF